jgi:hypothetical protein
MLKQEKPNTHTLHKEFKSKIIDFNKDLAMFKKKTLSNKLEDKEDVSNYPSSLRDKFDKILSQSDEINSLTKKFLTDKKEYLKNKKLAKRKNKEFSKYSSNSFTRFISKLRGKWFGDRTQNYRRSLLSQLATLEESMRKYQEYILSVKTIDTSVKDKFLYDVFSDYSKFHGEFDSFIEFSEELIQVIEDNPNYILENKTTHTNQNDEVPVILETEEVGEEVNNESKKETRFTFPTPPTKEERQEQINEIAGNISSVNIDEVLNSPEINENISGGHHMTEKEISYIKNKINHVMLNDYFNEMDTQNIIKYFAQSFLDQFQGQFAQSDYKLGVAKRIINIGIEYLRKKYKGEVADEIWDDGATLDIYSLENSEAFFDFDKLSQANKFFFKKIAETGVIPEIDDSFFDEFFTDASMVTTASLLKQAGYLNRLWLKLKNHLSFGNGSALRIDIYQILDECCKIAEDLMDRLEDPDVDIKGLRNEKENIHQSMLKIKHVLDKHRFVKDTKKLPKHEKK